ncbi:beta/gamma crystallin-related protein [Phenylobacterium sp.]|uniref:beta/gamma crystallin-related protein n=1 Tax=Phenylobacterium sp. TaxID=1871053 RepID=UPI0030F419E4
MRFSSSAALIAALSLTSTGAAAQSWGQNNGGNFGAGQNRAPTATLYELPNFQGRQMTVTATGENLASMNFNDLAQSARLQGRWRVCENSGYRGKCQDLSGQIADLNTVGMGGKISSLQGYFEGAWSRGGGWGGGGPQGGQPYEGATGVLFPYPNVVGFEIAANGSSASAYCRSMKLGSSAYYDSSQRARLALDGDGRYVAETSVLRDVFCRKR